MERRRCRTEEEMLEVARFALKNDRFVSFHRKSPNNVIESVKVQLVTDTQITFNCKDAGLGIIASPLSNLNYVELGY